MNTELTTNTITVKQNAFASFTLTVKNKTTGIPIDLTGITINFTVKDPEDNSTTDINAIITKDITVHSDPVNGITTLEILPIDTIGQEIDCYLYDITIDDGTSKPIYSRTGQFLIKKSETKRTA